MWRTGPCSGPGEPEGACAPLCGWVRRRRAGLPGIREASPGRLKGPGTPLPPPSPPALRTAPGDRTCGRSPGEINSTLWEEEYILLAEKSDHQSCEHMSHDWRSQLRCLMAEAGQQQGLPSCGRHISTSQVADACIAASAQLGMPWRSASLLDTRLTATRCTHRGCGMPPQWASACKAAARLGLKQLRELQQGRCMMSAAGAD